MNTKHKLINIKSMLSLLIILTFMFSVPFISSLSDKKIIDNKKYLNEIPQHLDIKDKKPLFSKERTYKNEFIEVKSHKNNKINTETSIFNKHYISIMDYEKVENENFEVSFYTGNNGIPYKVYKSDLVNISKEDVKKTGDVYIKEVYSKDGYVKINTKGFSSLILSVPDFTIPFHNTVSIDLQEYFSDVDHYRIFYYDPITENDIYVNEGYQTLNTDTFEFNLYRVGGDAFLDLYVYDSICSSLIVDGQEDCFYLGEDIINFNYLTILTYDENNNSLGFDNFNVNTPESPYYYRIPFTGRTGLHEDMVEAFTFNNFSYDNPNSELLGKWDTQLTNNGASYTTINEFKAGNYEGGAFEFDGNNDYLQSETSIILDSDSSSLSIWFKPSSLPGGMLLGQHVTSPLGGYIWVKDSTTIYLSAPVGGSSSATWLFPTMSTGTWYNLVITRNNGISRAYLNGVESTSGGISVSGGTNFRHIGRYEQLSPLWFHGSIDEIIVWDEPLTQQEISYIYNSGVGVDFFNLNTPQRVVNSFIQKDLEVGVVDMYLNNYFNYDTIDGDEYDFTYRYYDHITENWLNLTSGLNVTIGAPSDVFSLSLLGDKLTIIYYGNTDETLFGFDGTIYATDTKDNTETMTLALSFPLTSIGNVSQIQTIPYSQPTNFSLSMNTYFVNYTNIQVKYYDQNIENDSNYYLVDFNTSINGDIINEIGNINVTLDPVDVSGNIYLNVNGVGNNNYSNVMNITAYNSISETFDLIYITSGEAVEPSDLIKDTIDNQTLQYNSMVCIDSLDYFYNVTNVSVSFDYDNITYKLDNIINYDLVGPPTAVTNDTDDFTIYLTELGVYCFTSKYTELNLSIDFDVKDNLTNEATQNFYIFVIPTIPMTQGAEYLANLGNWFTGLFPSVDNLTNIQALGIVILVLLIATIGIITLLYNRFGNTSIYIAIGVDILLFLLFAGLNYISTGFLILIGLLLLALSYLKLRSS